MIGLVLGLLPAVAAIIFVASVVQYIGGMRGNPRRGLSTLVSVSVFAMALVFTPYILQKAGAIGETAKKSAPEATKSTPKPSTSQGSGVSMFLADHWVAVVLPAVAIALVIAVCVLSWWVITAGRRAAARRAESVAAFKESLAAWHTIDVERQRATDEWLAYDRDASLLLREPAMRDFTLRTTNDAAAAMIALDSLRMRKPVSSMPIKDVHGIVSTYEAASVALNLALKVARQYARTIALSSMPRADRKLLETAQRALAVALDEAASPSERKNALAVVRRAMKRLGIDEPPVAMTAIEAPIRQQIAAASR